MVEAKRLEDNLKHLQKHLPEWQGAPEVQDLQAAMNSLQAQFETKKSWVGGSAVKMPGSMPTNAVGFLSRNLAVPDVEAMDIES